MFQVSAKQRFRLRWVPLHGRDTKLLASWPKIARQREPKTHTHTGTHTNKKTAKTSTLLCAKPLPARIHSLYIAFSVSYMRILYALCNAIAAASASTDAICMLREYNFGSIYCMCVVFVSAADPRTSVHVFCAKALNSANATTRARVRFWDKTSVHPPRRRVLLCRRDR